MVKGWHKESRRHSLASRGIKTAVKGKPVIGYQGRIGAKRFSVSKGEADFIKKTKEGDGSWKRLDKFTIQNDHQMDKYQISIGEQKDASATDDKFILDVFKTKVKEDEDAFIESIGFETQGEAKEYAKRQYNIRF